ELQFAGLPRRIHSQTREIDRRPNGNHREQYQRGVSQAEGALNRTEQNGRERKNQQQRRRRQSGAPGAKRTPARHESPDQNINDGSSETEIDKGGNPYRWEKAVNLR